MLVPPATECMGPVLRSSIRVSTASDGANSLHVLALLLRTITPAAAFKPSRVGMFYRASTPAFITQRQTILDGCDDAKMKLQQLRRSMFAGTAAVGVAFSSSPTFALASQAASVDKTGPIGSVASLFEDGIEYGHSTLGSYGVSIIAFTLVIRLLQLPLQINTLEYQEKMKSFKPLQDKLWKAYSEPEEEEEKYKIYDDLMKATDTYPAAGSVAPIVQISILLCFIRSLKNLIAENKFQEAFLWAPSLEGPVYSASPDHALDWFTSIFSGSPSLGWDRTLAFLSLPAIYWLVQVISMKLLQRETEVEADSESNFQEQLTQFFSNYLPFFTTFFSLQVPAALSMYWIVSNIIGTITTLCVRQITAVQPMSPAASEIEALLDRRLESMARLEGRREAMLSEQMEAIAALEPVMTTSQPQTAQIIRSRLRWKEVMTESNEPYYWELETGRTQWELPEQGWIELFNDDGPPYYWDPETDTTQWTKP